MHLGVPSELLDDRLVGAVGIVLDIVAIDRDGVFEVAIDDGVFVRLERLDYPVAQPFAERGGAPQPWIRRLARGRTDDAGDLLVVRRRLLEPALEDDDEAGEQ